MIALHSTLDGFGLGSGGADLSPASALRGAASPAGIPSSSAGANEPRPATGEVEVWSAPLDHQPIEALQFMQSVISADEAERAAGFYFERDRRRFVVARGILRLLLARYLGCPPRELAFRYGAHGKPALAGPSTGVHFNLAHSEGLAVYAFTRAGEVGIDVECLRDLPDWEQVAEAAFSAHELARLRACPVDARRDEFFRAWTRQEAVLKALGTGLGDTGQVGAETAFNVYPLAIAPGFAAALACSPAARRPDKIHGWTEAGAAALPAERTLYTDLL